LASGKARRRSIAKASVTEEQRSQRPKVQARLLPLFIDGSLPEGRRSSKARGMQEPKALRSWERELHWENLAKASPRAETGGWPKSRDPKARKKGVALRRNSACGYRP